MLDKAKAYEIAQNELPSCILTGCVDIGSAYLFSFGKLNEETGMWLPGVPSIKVGKEDGIIEHITIPPVSNLELWKSGMSLSIEELL